MNLQNIQILLDQAERKMCHCYYSQARKLLREILSEAHRTGSRDLRYLTSEALNEARRRHILGVLRFIKTIRSFCFSS